MEKKLSIVSEQRHTYCRISHLFCLRENNCCLSSWILSWGISKIKKEVLSNTFHLLQAHSPSVEPQKSSEYSLMVWYHRYSWKWEPFKWGVSPLLSSSFCTKVKLYSQSLYCTGMLYSTETKQKWRKESWTQMSIRIL